MRTVGPVEQDVREAFLGKGVKIGEKVPDGETAWHAQVGAGRKLPRVKRIQRLAKEGRLSGLREALDEKQVSGGGSL